MRLLRIYPKPKLWSNEWFEVWQVFLLLGVNSPIKSMREEVRQRLGIVLERNILIDRLLRNSFRIKIGEREYQETFYSKPIFAIALQKEWNWFWQLIHKWDMNIANRFAPALNLGFDTLTVYPDAGFGATTCDAPIIRDVTGNPVNFSTLRHGDGTNVATQTASDYLAMLVDRDAVANKFSVLGRTGFTFNTSSIGSGGTISSAVFSLRGIDKYTLFGEANLNLVVVSFSPSNNATLTEGDFTYTKWGTTIFAQKTFPEFFASGANDFTLNSSGIANISLTGISRFGTILEWDRINTFTGTWEPYGSAFFYAYMTDSTITENKPRLTITYFTPSGFTPRTIMI